MRAQEPPGGRRNGAALRTSLEAAALHWPHPPASHPEEFASRVRGFGLEVIQIERGRFTANGLQIRSGKILLGKAEFGRAVVQSWISPARSVTIAVKTGNAGALWRGFALGASDSLLIGPLAKLEIVSEPEFSLVAATFPQHYFQRLAESLGFSAQFDEFGVIVNRLSGPEAAGRLRGALEALIAQALTLAPWPDQPGARDDLLRRVVSVASTGRQINPQDRNLDRWRAVDHAVERLRTQAPDTLSILDFRHAIGVSERALRTGFVERYTLSPCRFVKAFRLNGARKDLRRLAGPGLKITEIAKKWGFWHLGQFASDYRSWFGELPSETLRRGIRRVAEMPPARWG
jgi:AraC family ethanolamine operon transcriptional activator